MALLSSIEARSLRGRTIHAGVVVALLLVTATTLYPFLVMLSGSLRSEFDAADLDLIPAYLHDPDTLYRKFLANKYDQDPTLANEALLRQSFSFRTFPLPDHTLTRQQRDALEAFLTDPATPRHWQTLGGSFSLLDAPENMRRLQSRVFERYDGDLTRVSADLGTVVEDWALIRMAQPRWLEPNFLLLEGPMADAYFEVIDARPAAERVPVSLSGHFLRSVVYPVYGQYDPDAYNRALGDDLADFHAFRLPDRPPTTDRPAMRAAWIDYARNKVNPSFVLTEGLNANAYRAALTGLGLDPAFVADAAVPDGRWLTGREREAYERFLQRVDPDRLRLIGPEFVWARTQPHAPPLALALAAFERDYVHGHAGALRLDFATRNYINVWRELTVQGRVLRNTAVFCGLALAAALLVNPLAAYALSRFRLPATYKVLLFLIATVAFPPMVTMIPQFILLRNAGLLNTFVALVLPLVVNGYMIFLLKGFFDALPQELYEAATIDGAGEVRMFFQITMALSKPILAVLALGTFTSAYTMFLYPLLVAPDQDMWLMSVWLFQFQQRSTSAAVFASVVIASVPTMMIFLVTQRQIMRGIAVPSEK